MNKINSDCLNCEQKQLLIQKYQKLIKLLKTKCHRTSKSVQNNQNLQLMIQNTSTSSLSSGLNTQDIQSLNSSRQARNTADQIYKVTFHLPLLILTNKPKKAILKQTFDLLKKFTFQKSQTQQTELCMLQPISSENQINIEQMIQETLSYGKTMQKENYPNHLSIKDMQSQIFSLQLKNEKYLLRISKLEKQLQEIQKRFFKQTQKKRESLQTVAQELRQKTDQIIQLQHTIKKYQKLIGKKSQKSTQNILIEDQEQITKTCIRLQNVNQKLNQDLRLTNQKVDRLNHEIDILATENKKLKEENNQLKQEKFEILAEQSKNTELNEIYLSLSQKLNKKIESLKKYEKQINFSATKSLKCLTMLSSADTAVSKNNQISQFTVLPVSLSTRDLNNEQKIEQLFSFLFNIENQQHKITNESLFDQDQLSLLKNHKLTFINNLKTIHIPTIRMQSQKIFKKNDPSQTDEVFYIKSNQPQQNNSFFNALQEDFVEPKRHSCSQNMKLIEMEIEKNGLIEKISQLKNLNLHIRSVVLNLLKTLDLSSPNQECQNILQIVFEFFEYSEEEKSSFFKEKKTKKFWGLL